MQGLRDTIVCNVDGTTSCDQPTILLKEGRNRVHLYEYLNDYHLILETTDDSVIEGNEICTGAPDAIVFSHESIENIDWPTYQTNIHREFGANIKGEKPIQTVLQELLSHITAGFLLGVHFLAEILYFLALILMCRIVSIIESLDI